MWQGVLRCRTWNVWPEHVALEFPSVEIQFESATTLQVYPSVVTYAQSSLPEQSLFEPTGLGPPLWDGETPGLHRLRDFILKAPEDSIPLSQHLRNAGRGELDIRLSFKLDRDPPDPLVDALRSNAYQILALMNLELDDFVRPTMPFQLRQVLPNNQQSLKFTLQVGVESRKSLSSKQMSDALLGVAHFLTDPKHRDKHRVALELYAAHFAEQQARVRFILLVIAMEALAESSPKHQVALDLLGRWQDELTQEKLRYDSYSEEFYSLNALSRELDFRAGDSVNNTIRKLFADLPGVEAEERSDMQRRAIRLYSKRSVLVHDGYLPAEELASLEAEARSLLEKLFSAEIDRRATEHDRLSVEIEERPRPGGPHGNP